MVLSKEVTADNTQVSSGGSFWGFSISGVAADHATVRSGSESGPILAKAKLTAEMTSFTVFFSKAVSAGAGLWVNFEAGTPSIVVYYEN